MYAASDVFVRPEPDKLPVDLVRTVIRCRVNRPEVGEVVGPPEGHVVQMISVEAACSDGETPVRHQRVEVGDGARLATDLGAAGYDLAYLLVRGAGVGAVDTDSHQPAL